MHRESPQINARLACICTACRRHAHWGGCGVDSHTLCGSRMNRVLCGTVWKCEGVERRCRERGKQAFTSEPLVWSASA